MPRPFSLSAAPPYDVAWIRLAQEPLGDQMLSTSRSVLAEPEVPSRSAGNDKQRPVCPRCGTAAEEHQVCLKCDLDLGEQSELPTREAWEHQVLAALEAFGSESTPSRVRWLLPFLAAVALLVGAGWLVTTQGEDQPAGPDQASGADRGDSLGGAALSLSERRCVGDWNGWIAGTSRATTGPARVAGEQDWIGRVSIYKGGSTPELNPGDCVITLVDGSSGAASIFASLQGNYANVSRTAPPLEVKKLERAAQRHPNVAIDASGYLRSP